MVRHLLKHSLNQGFQLSRIVRFDNINEEIFDHALESHLHILGEGTWFIL